MTKENTALIVKTAASTFALLGIGAAAFVMAFILFSNRASINTIINNSRDISSNTKASTERLDKFLTNERLVRLDEALQVQLDATEQTTINYALVAKDTRDTLKNHVQPAIDELRLHSKQTFEDVHKISMELNTQIHNNGNAINALLDETRLTVVETRQQVLAELQELNKVTHGLSVITNDPEIIELIKNSNRAMSNTADTIGNIEVITKETADLATHLIEPILRPKPAKGLAKVYRPVVRVLRTLSGAGNVLFLLDRVN